MSEIIKDHKGNEYQLGAIYEFSTSGGSEWFVFRLEGFSNEMFIALQGTVWSRIREPESPLGEVVKSR